MRYCHKYMTHNTCCMLFYILGRLFLTLRIDISSHLSVLTCIVILVLLLLYPLFTLFGFIVLLMCSFDTFWGILLNAHFEKGQFASFPFWSLKDS